MTAIAVESLDGVDLDGSPPCSINRTGSVNGYTSGKICSQPAVCRLVTTCAEHGTARDFACAGCRDDIIAGLGRCYRCYNPRPFGGFS